jgi:hypothetical protein
MWQALWATAGLTGNRKMGRVQLFSKRHMVNVARIKIAKINSENQIGVPKPMIAGEKNAMANPKVREKHAISVNSQSYKEKQSENSKRMWENKDYVEKFKARVSSNEHREKASKAQKEKWLDPEYRERISASRKGLPAHNKGKPMSDEQKKKLSVAHKGKTITEAAKLKISEALKGLEKSPETRAKLSASLKGRKCPWAEGVPRSDETKAKCSEAQKGKSRPQTTGGKNGYATRIVCLDTNEIFDCLADAKRKYPGASNISAVCSGKRPKAGGYRWAYA